MENNAVVASDFLKEKLKEGLKNRKCHEEDFRDYYELKSNDEILEEVYPILKKIAFKFKCDEKTWEEMTKRLCKTCFVNYIIGVTHEVNKEKAIEVFSGKSDLLTDFELVKLHAAMICAAENPCNG